MSNMLTKINVHYDDNSDLMYKLENYKGLVKEKIVLSPGEVFFAHSNLIHYCGASINQLSKTIGIVKKKSGKGWKGVILPHDVTHMSMHTYVGKDKELHFNRNELSTIPVIVDESKLEKVDESST